MVFGKRIFASASAAMARAQDGDAGAAPVSRIESLRDRMVGLFETTRRIADAVRADGTIAMPAGAEIEDAEAGPLVLKGFHEHFVTNAPAGVGHVIYAYRHPDGRTAIDASAHHHLQQLTGQALAFNLYCQRAHRDEALGVALQSPDVPAAVDGLLVRAAFFVAFFDNMIGHAPPPDMTVPRSVVERQRATLDRHLLMARDAMMATGRLESLVPLKAWPFIGVEVPIAPHAGDHFINGVYFAADDARTLLSERSGIGLRLVA